MGVSDAFIQEIEQEAKTTRTVLERVPTDKLSWKPHAKSMSLGELAQHIAGTPGMIATWALGDSFDFGDSGPTVVVTSTAEILANHDRSVATAKDIAKQLGDSGLGQRWEGKMKGATIFKMPKAALIRSIAINHWIHHRGQLSVYLRLLDVPVPSIYGPSADENPFA